MEQERMEGYKNFGILLLPTLALKMRLNVAYTGTFKGTRSASMAEYIRACRE